MKLPPCPGHELCFLSIKVGLIYTFYCFRHRNILESEFKELSAASVCPIKQVFRSLPPTGRGEKVEQKAVVRNINIFAS